MANSTASNDSLANTTDPPDYIIPYISTFASYYSFYNNLVLAPVVSGIGFFLNLVCCGVFLTANFKMRMYKLLFWTSFFHAFALLIQTFQPILLDVPLGYSFGACVYRMALRTWIYNAFTMTALLCNIAVSFDRYIMVSRKCKCFCSNIPVYVLVGIFLVFSLACFCFPMFAYYIGPWTSDLGNEYFWVYYTDFAFSPGFDYIRFVMFGFRDCVLWFTFVIINVMLLLETKKHFRNHKRLTLGFGKKSYGPGQSTAASTSPTALQANQAAQNNTRADSEKNRAERRITLMVVVTSVVLIFGQVTYFIAIMCTTLTHFTVPSPSYYFRGATSLIYTTSILSNQIGYSVLFFVFFFFDKNFKGFIVQKIFRKN
jgi:hypothetical protein